MQGFNRYIPPDFDPKQTSTLNSYQGKKHALGKRAKDIDKGILVVRFELPFNIWCGGCNAHIGAGVRYNSQKKKVGNYFSTPIYGFRCKCHLCSHWFEIRTDPKNAAYIVYEGAKKKDEDWDPEQNGGYAVIDSEAPSASLPPADPFSAVEKTIDQQTWAARGTSRLTELTRASERLAGDPYLISSALRRKFREEKKVMLDKQGREDSLKERFGLGSDVILDDEDVDREKAREMWIAQRENRGLPVNQPDDDGESSSHTSLAAIKNGESSTNFASALASASIPTPRNTSGARRKGKAPEASLSASNTNTNTNLAQVLRTTTNKKFDPFALPQNAFTTLGPNSRDGTKVKVKGRVREGILGGFISKATLQTKVGLAKGKDGEMASPAITPGGGLLAGYESD